MNTVLHIAAHQPFISTLAQRILSDAKERVPDLEHCQIFLPNTLAARQLRRALIAQSPLAIIGPHISSMEQWVNDHLPLSDETCMPVNQASRQLILFEALKQHRQLFNENNLWQICNSLLQFFDELSQNNFEMDQYSESQWQTQLQNAYGINANTRHDMNHLFHEARIVYTLWQAWQQQTRAMQVMDTNTLYQWRLQQVVDMRVSGMYFYVVGFDQLCKAEQQWCQQIEATACVIYISQIVQDDDNAFSQFIHTALDVTQPLTAITEKNTPDLTTLSPHCISLFAAPNAETEARAIHMQTRCWLTEKKQHIAIISENRKLMRRVRALMERSGIVVEDTAGWSIATTSAATCIERWLQCIEQDFAWQPMLDLLKSPFFCTAQLRGEHLKNVFRLEQDIIVYERITANLSRYKKALQHRHARLPQWHPETHTALLQLLVRLADASSALIISCRSNKAIDTREHLALLLTSLNTLGITTQLADDAAGAIVLQQLQKMQHAAEQSPCNMQWRDFRTWLANNLEQQPFTPKGKPSTVHLLNLKQAEYCEFDAVIIASANAEFLPGRPVQTPFFNQSVRRALKLKTWADEKAGLFSRFSHILQAAPNRLMSYQAEHDGEWMQPSPWLQSLHDYALRHLNINLHNTALHTLLRNEANHDAATQNNLATQTQPSPIVTTALQAARWSVSSYQRIIDCPYKFFAADVLSLRAEEHITKELQRSEYGEKIHETLRAFFEQRPHLPAPFKHPVTTQNREQAYQHLLNIAQTLFARDIENNVQHQGWLQQWSATAKTFINWLIERQMNWSFYQAEVSAQREIDEYTQLHGRLDLIESNSDGLAIIDYKSGASPTKKSVLDGENIQLTAYAMLMENVKQVGFLKLDKKKTAFSADISHDDLAHLTTLNFSRLQALTQNIRDGQGLTAWGDIQTCQTCDMAGLCRKQIWQSASR